MSRSFESMRWSACVHRLDLGLYSHPKEFFREWSQNSRNSEGNIPLTGGSQEGRTHDAASRIAANHTHFPLSYPGSTEQDRLVGLVVRRPPRERKVSGSNPACAGIFSGSSHTSDLNIGTPATTLPGAWRYWVSTGTGRPGVSILGLGEVERLICNFYLGVAARKIV